MALIVKKIEDRFENSYIYIYIYCIVIGNDCAKFQIFS